MLKPSPLSSNTDESPSMGAGFNFADPHSSWARFYLDRGQLLAVAMISSLFLIAVNIPLWHTDIWGHLAFGQWMLTHGELPAATTFSSSADPNSVFEGTYWLSQGLFYLVYRAGELLAGGGPLQRMAGGVELLIYLHAGLLVLRSVLLFLAFQRLSGSSLSACLALAVTFALQIGHLAILRPQVVGEVLLAAFLYLLAHVPVSRRGVMVMPILTVLWANCHGSYLLAFALMGGFLAGRLLQRRFDLQVRRLGLAILASGLGVCLLTPAGPGTFAHTLQMSAHPNVQAMDEWQPLRWGLDSGPMWFYLVTLALVGVAPWLARRFYSPTQVLLLLGFGMLPLLHQRGMVWWLAVVPVLVLPQFALMRQRRLAQTATPNESAPPCLRKTMLAVVVMLFAVWLSTPVQWARAGHPRPLGQVVSAGTPWPIAAHLTEAGTIPPLQEVLQAHYPEGRFVGGIFASEMLGDYFLWSLPPEHPVFIYSHVHLFPPEHWEKVATVKRGEPGWDEILKEAGVNMVVVEPEIHPSLRVELYQSEEWQVLSDETGDEVKGNKRFRLMVALRKVPIVSE